MNIPHEFFKTGDADAPSQIKDRNGEIVLQLCRRCGKAESELTPFCDVPVSSSRPQTLADLLRIYEKQLAEIHAGLDGRSYDLESIIVDAFPDNRDATFTRLDEKEPIVCDDILYGVTHTGNLYRISPAELRDATTYALTETTIAHAIASRESYERQLAKDVK